MTNLEERMRFKLIGKEDTKDTEFAITTEDASRKIEALQMFVKTNMVLGQDYGLIPGSKKPTLLKPGSEKLCDLFGLSTHIEIINRIESIQESYFSYEVKAIVINKVSGLIEAEGIGCCNSRENEYADKSAFDIANTLLKMAKKRAVIDAVLSATKSSFLFTQDIESIQQLKSSDNQEKTENGGRDKIISKITPNQESYIMKLINRNKLSSDNISQTLSERYKVNITTHLTSKQASDFIAYLRA
jgi:hypothetical protein